MREAELYVSTESLEALGVGRFFAELHDVSVNDITMLSCDGTRAVFAISVEASLDDTLDQLDAIEWWERVVEESRAITYLCKVVASGIPEQTVPGHERSVDQQATSLDENGVSVSVVGSQEALGSEVANLRSAGADVVLRRLGDYSGPTNVLDSLTDRQREVLETAREVGYYEVPRRATVDTIADCLDIGASTVCEHLQRAERHLVEAALSD